MQPGSALYNEQSSYVLRDIKETLESYEITDISYATNTTAIVSTRETYTARVSEHPLQLMTQAVRYQVEKVGDDWKMTAFVDLNVVSRINKTANT